MDLGPPPVAINDATSALLIGTDGLPRTLTTRTEIIRVPPAATAFSELPVVATIRPGQVVAFEAGLRFLESPQALGVEPEDRVTFTALFRAEGPVLPEPPDPKFVDPFELAQKYGDRPRRGGVMKGSVVENYPHFDFNQGFSSDIIGLSGLYNGLLMRNPYDYREILPDLAYA